MPKVDNIGHSLAIGARHFPLSRNANWLWFVREYIKRQVSES